MPYTYLLYCNPHIKCDLTSSNHKLVTTQDIQTGTLLLLEHGLSSQQHQKLTWIVSNNDTLFNSLYPRLNTHEELISKDEERYTQAFDKVICNVFHRNNEYILNYYTSACNHSCTPNATVHLYNYNKVPLTAIIAINNIKKGTEINFMYYENAGHSEECKFICKCNLSLKERQHRFSVINKVTTSISNSISSIVDKLFYDYCVSNHFWEVHSHQIMAFELGLYFSTGTITITKRFSDYYYQRFGIQFSQSDDKAQENINKLINQLIVN